MKNVSEQPETALPTSASTDGLTLGEEHRDDLHEDASEVAHPEQPEVDADAQDLHHDAPEAQSDDGLDAPEDVLDAPEDVSGGQEPAEETQEDDPVEESSHDTHDVTENEPADPYAETDPGFILEGARTGRSLNGVGGEKGERGAVVLVRANKVVEQDADSSDDVRDTNRFKAVKAASDGASTAPVDELAADAKQTSEQDHASTTGEPITIDYDTEDSDRRIEQARQAFLRDLLMEGYAGSELTDENYRERVSLPFKVVVTEHDQKMGIRKTTFNRKQKDAVFPIPVHQHVPGVVDMRQFGVERRAASNKLAPVIAVLVFLGAVVLCWWLLG